MRNDDILILKGSEINSLLAGQELRVIDIVRMAYEAHGRGESSLPHSTFLRFPDNPVPLLARRLRRNGYMAAKR